MAFLAGLNNLTCLDLQFTRVTDKGLAILAGLNNLTWLDLHCTRLTDPGLAHLKGLVRLEYLNLEGTYPIIRRASGPRGMSPRRRKHSPCQGGEVGVFQRADRVERAGLRWFSPCFSGKKA
jgi:hypothetical protein